MKLNICNTPQSEKIKSEKALIQSTAWQIAKDRGYSNAAFALPEAITLVKDQRRHGRSI